MTTGCLIFAYDSDIAYGPQAVLAAALVIKHLDIPVSLVTDSATLNNLDNYKIFHNIIIRELGDVKNTRVLGGNNVIWKNTNRANAYDLSPYDRTLVIDSDFLVFSNALKTYLNSDRDFLICESMNDLLNRPGASLLLDNASVPMLWATNIIFNKTVENKILFDLIDHIRENWIYYGALYKFNTTRFRNDYAFSIACHIMGGQTGESYHIALPSPVLFNISDEMVKVSNEGITVLTADGQLFRTKGQDLHVLNKIDLLKNYNKLLELL